MVKMPKRRVGGESSAKKKKRKCQMRKQKGKRRTKKGEKKEKSFLKSLSRETILKMKEKQK
ncbi:MAG: hypothetical protein LGB53_05645 [Sulfurovum sp.]|nr:hypothetical protein [Sulfurovum sp.]